MADAKAESMAERPLTNAAGATLGFRPADVAIMNKQMEQRRENVIAENHASNYDPKSNRCYVEIFEWKRIGATSEIEIQSRNVYDAQTDDLLAFANIKNGKKVGMVDPDHRAITDANLGWDDADAYMDEKMRARRK
jgi:hypothetical protein